MELTLDEAFKRGIAAHQAGKTDEADRYYTAILNAQPKHPDVNHNMGILAVGIGKFEQALPFFKTAIEANSGVEQYWISYINTLLNLQHVDAAKAAVVQAKKSGSRGDVFDQFDEVIRRQLSGSTSVGQDPPQHQLQPVIDLYKRGELEEALARVRPLLNIFPLSITLLNIQGAAYAGCKRFDEAIESYREAIKVSPESLVSYTNLGSALKESGDLEGAIDVYLQVIKIDSTYADAYFNMGNALKTQGNIDEAIDSFRQAVAANPAHVSAHNNIGTALKAKGDMAGALDSFMQAVEFKPDFAEGHYNLGVTKKELGDLEGAISSYRRAVRINPDYVEAHNNLGVLIQDHGDLEGAVASYRQALMIKPDFAEAYSNMGTALKEKGDLVGAVDQYQMAVELNPNLSDAHNNMGLALKEKGDLDHAIASYKRAIDCEGDHAEYFSNMGVAQQEKGYLNEAMESYSRALTLRPDYAVAYSNMLFCVINNREENRATIFDAHCEFSERFEQPLVQFWPKHANGSDSERGLKVGFVSADFREHAVAYFFEPTIKMLCGLPSYTFYAYHNLAHEDDITRGIKRHFAHWVPVSNLTDEQLSAKVIEDGIDILIDLSGHSAGNRLLAFARKPAPVQVSWMGYPGTTGLQSMDYFMGPGFALPAGECDDQFSEKVVGLPFTVSYLPAIEYPAVNTLPALANGYITFGSFFRPSKINRAVIAVWSELLRAIPSAKLVMGGMLGDLDDNDFIKWFAEEAIDLGRVTFLARTDMSHYCSMHHRVDLCLAPFPYVGGTTISTALMMGVPTLVMNGGTLTSSGGAGRMHYVGHGEYIAANEGEFIAKGVELSGDVERLSRTRMALRDKTLHSYTDTELMRSSMDKAFRTMWGRWCDGLEPIAFEVEV